FFFSGPLNIFNLQQDWARSDDDQRHHVTFDATVHTPTSTGNSAWQKLSHGFQLSGILQYYSALPFTAVSGVSTIQQTSGRPCEGLAATAAACTIPAMIGRNTWQGFDFFTLSSRLSRTFAIGERVRLEAIAEAFNVLNHRNDLIPNTTFGTGIYP